MNTEASAIVEFLKMNAGINPDYVHVYSNGAVEVGVVTSGYSAEINYHPSRGFFFSGDDQAAMIRGFRRRLGLPKNSDECAIDFILRRYRAM